MNFNELFHFAARCLALDNHPEFREIVIAAFDEEKVDYLDLVKLCSDHLVLPALYLQLNNNNLMHLFPDELASHIEDLYDLNCIYYPFSLLLKLYDLLFKKYLLMIMSLPFNKSNRQHLFNRLRDKQWYGIHCKGLRRSF